MKAIVYTLNTGHTAEYAKMLGDKTGLPVYSLREAALYGYYELYIRCENPV